MWHTSICLFYNSWGAGRRRLQQNANLIWRTVLNG
jgi:hypothetical protein